MQISAPNAPFETQIFILLLLATLLLTLKRTTKDKGLFPIDTTTQLKGFAILTIIFGHIGYFLSKDPQFLYPLSVASGVGVNLFLFLSGFGLTVSHLKKPLGILEFYRKRLSRLFIPMWIVITILLLTFYFFFQITYPTNLIIKNYLGIFPIADLFTSLNSVLWYFSFIFFYYLVFPVLTIKPILKISFILIYIASLLTLKIPPPIGKDVLDLYRLHLYAFPLGVFAALIPTYLPKNLASNISELIKQLNPYLKTIIILLLTVIFCYYSIHSGVGGDKKTEQYLSLITMFAAIFIFILLPFRFNFLQIIGDYSYEIYLLHWPLLFHFDFLYKTLPPFIATFLYLFFFIAASYLLRKASNFIISKTSL